MTTPILSKSRHVSKKASLFTEVGVACVPGSSFYRVPGHGAQQVRFCFCKKDETLNRAAERLLKLR